MNGITDAQRAAIYRELADEVEHARYNTVSFNELRKRANKLDSPEGRWHRSLPEVPPPSSLLGRFDSALINLRLALKHESVGPAEQMVAYSQLAAAHIVAWRRALPEPDPIHGGWSSGTTERGLLRHAMKAVLDADAGAATGEYSSNLLIAESALRELWERHGSGKGESGER